MRLEDYQSKSFDDILGVYKNGEKDQVPENYFSECYNLDYGQGEWTTRPGLSIAYNLGYGGPVRRFATFNDPDIGPLTLVLDNSGNFYTFSSRAGDTATSPLFTVASATDFSAIKMLGKIYIAVHDGNFGILGQNLRVYIPHPTTPASDVVRDVGGLTPVAASPMAATNGAAGIVNVGLYAITVAYITTTGFVTPPGPKIAGTYTPTFYTAPGSQKINLSNIPIGPAGTAKRQILITKANESEMFFLSSAFGGLINDNITTTAILDFDDTTDLIESADYLFDLLETVPSPLALQDYNGRLCAAGERNNPSVIRVSRPGEPEAFDNTNGAVFVSVDDGFTMRNMSVVRNTLYAWKNLGVYSVRDNGDVPINWPVNPIDQNVNIGVHGIGEFFDMAGIRMARDWTLIADRAGILLFDGIVRKPPITDNINDVWQTINWAQFHKIVLVIDEQFHKIYCVFPTGSNTECDTFIMGDYNGCPGTVPSINGIKWCANWQFYPGASLLWPTEIGIFGIPGIDIIPTLKIGSTNAGTMGKIWKLDPAVLTDNGQAIECQFETALLSWDLGSLHSFNALQIRVVGVGSLIPSAYNLDANTFTFTQLPTITLSLTPGKVHLVRFNYPNVDKAAFRFTMIGGKMTVSHLEIYGKVISQMRPA